MIKFCNGKAQKIRCCGGIRLYEWVVKSVGGSDTCKGGHSLTIGFSLNTASELALFSVSTAVIGCVCRIDTKKLFLFHIFSGTGKFYVRCYKNVTFISECVTRFDFFFSLSLKYKRNGIRFVFLRNGMLLKC